MNSRRLCLLAAMYLIPHPSFATTTLADDVLGSLYSMRSVYHAEYAPAEWKRKHIGYDLDTEFNKAVAAVQGNPSLTLKDSRAILKNFIYSMQDYHTSISFVSTETATLPFIVHSVGDSVYIVYIDRTKLTSDAFPFEVGDELVTFGDKSAAQAITDVQGEFIGNIASTDRALADYALTRRRASRGYDVPHGPIDLSIRRQGSEQISHIQMIWDYTPEQIAPRQNLLFKEAKAKSQGHIFHPKMSVDLPQASDTDSAYDIGARKTFTPDLGPKVWETSDDNSFYAYIYKTADRKLIGYVRIPSYVPDDAAKAVADFAKIITQFQSVTDAMVIDQVNNPGGSVFYLYALASMLTDQPLKTPRHHMSLTQADVAAAAEIIPDLEKIKTDDDARKNLPPKDYDGFPISYELARFSLSYAHFIVDQWNAGHRLTDPYWIAGVDHINPAPVHYTKPILLLVNHLDFSGGDFFPTIMQDNHRVTVMGSRTAGAGGYVADVHVPNSIGIDAFRVTESIAERVDGNPIENLGVTPELIYEMTSADYTQNYSPYATAIQQAVNGLIH